MAPPAPSEPDLDLVVETMGRLFDEGKKELLLETMRSVMEAALADNRAVNLRLAEELKRTYGRSSERIDPNQLKLFLGELRQEQQREAEPEPTEEMPCEPPPPKPKSNKDRRRARRPLPATLPREQVRLVPTAEQLESDGSMTKISEERSEVLEYEPARFKVIEYIRETWSNGNGDIVTAAAPLKIIDKGLPGVGLLTHVLLAKFVDHCG